MKSLKNIKFKEIAMRSLLIVALSIIVFFVAGCIFDSDTKKSEDKGTYTLEVETTGFWDEKTSSFIEDGLVSYPGGGGGLFILIMKPGEDFEGEVRLTVNATPLLNVELTNDLLSSDKRVAEVVIYPDSKMAVGVETIRVISEHAGVIDELELSVEIIKSETEDFTPPSRIEFVLWS